MRSKNPEVMNAICTFVDQYYREHHASPSVNEIAQGVGVSKATSYRYLVAMNERGMLSYNGKTIVTKQVGKCTSGYFSAPVVGSIRCGDPEREEESVEEYVSLPKSIFGEGKFYILRAKGDSMVDAGIEDEDLIVIRIQDTAAVGDIVVALDEDNENTLKIFGGIDEENGDVILRNYNLYLEETDGWMECEHCHQVVQILVYAKTKPIPVYTGRALAEKFLTSTK